MGTKNNYFLTRTLPWWPVRTLLQTFNLDATSVQGSIASLKMFFMTCCRLDATDRTHRTLFFLLLSSLFYHFEMVHEVVHGPGLHPWTQVHVLYTSTLTGSHNNKQYLSYCLELAKACTGGYLDQDFSYKMKLVSISTLMCATSSNQLFHL